MTTQDRFLSNTRRLMEEQNASILGMTRGTGMSETHVTKVIKGKCAITLRTMDRFAKVFGVEPWELIR